MVCSKAAPRSHACRGDEAGGCVGFRYRQKGTQACIRIMIGSKASTKSPIENFLGVAARYNMLWHASAPLVEGGWRVQVLPIPSNHHISLPETMQRRRHHLRRWKWCQSVSASFKYGQPTQNKAQKPSTKSNASVLGLMLQTNKTLSAIPIELSLQKEYVQHWKKIGCCGMLQHAADRWCSGTCGFSN